MALNDDGRRIMDAAREAYGPSQADRTRIGEALALKLAAATTATAAAHSAAAARPLAMKLIAVCGKLAIVGALAGGLAAAGYSYWGASGSPAVSPSAPGVSSRSAPRTGVAPHVVSEMRGTPAEFASVANEPAAPAQASATRTSQRLSRADPAQPSQGPDVEGEVALLGAAQKALASGQPKRALALLEQHQRRFPSAALTQERNAVRIMALCKLGQTARARREAAAFGRQSPESPLTERVRAVCGSSLGSGGTVP
ncbi:MAG: hypothetical protein JW940_22220 [Polyangiaceae bacterium]|nr:hypothetical protein [Polyangiaceae bacterium]